jgi:hypothetical protein
MKKFLALVAVLALAAGVFAQTSSLPKMSVGTFRHDVTLSTNTTAANVNAASGNVVVTLPKANTVKGQIFFAGKADASANTVTVTAAAGDTIGGAGTYVLTAQYMDCLLVSDGRNTWYNTRTTGDISTASACSIANTLDVSGALTAGDSLTVTGATALNGGLALDTSVLTVANTTGVLSSVPTTTTGSAWTLDFSTLTSGNGLKMVGVDATLNAGKYVNLYGGTGSTSVWSVGEGGATRITPNVATIAPLYIDGTVSTSANLIEVKAVDATLNGGKYFRAMGGAGATEVWSVAENGRTNITPNAVDSLGLYIDGALTTTGNLVELVAVDATLNGGGYVVAKGGAGAAEVFSVKEDGATAITSTVATTNGLTIYNESATTGDLLTLTADDDAFTTGGYYLTCLGGTNHATRAFSVANFGSTEIIPTAAGAAVDAFAVDGTTLTTGDLVQLKAIDGTLNGGLYLNCLGGAAGATVEFTVGEGGTVAATGLVSLNGGLALDTAVLTVADTTGVISHVPTTTTGTAVTHDFTALTSGDGVSLKAVDATLNGGKYLNVYGGAGATSVASIGEGGALLLTPNVATIAPLYIDGTVSTSANLVTLKAVNATFNGGKYIQCLNTATPVFDVAEEGDVTTAGDLDVTGTSRLAAVLTATDATDTVNLTSAYYGKILILTHADNVAVTLPANGAAAGSWVDVMLAGDDSLAATVSAATTDTLVGPNDQDLKSVTWGAGHRIGAYAKFISDGSFWHVLNLGGTTATYND